MSRHAGRQSQRMQSFLRQQVARAGPAAAPATTHGVQVLAEGTQPPGSSGDRRSAMARGLCYGIAAAAVAAGCCGEAQAKQAEGDLPESPTGTAASNTGEGGTHLVPLRKKQQLYFLYEKRIRDLSNSEKVFEYFANEKLPDGSTHMRPQDLLAALVPVYPPEGEQVTRSGSLPGEPRGGLAPSTRKDVSNFFLKHFDIDDDGLISFQEYLLIITLLSVPLEDADTAFSMLDTDDSGVIDKVEFEALTSVLQSRTPRTAGAGAGRTGFASEPGVDKQGLLAHFFGPRGDRHLDLNTFYNFLADLHAEIDRLEFQHYDPHDRGYMSGRDFAHSMIASVSMRSIHGLLQRVEELPPVLQGARITSADFHTFTELWRKVHQLHVATDLTYNSIGRFSRKEMKRASRKITGKALSDAQVDIIYELFDVEKDGSLAVSEFVGVIKQRERRHIASTDSELVAEMQTMGLFQCFRSCCGL